MLHAYRKPDGSYFRCWPKDVCHEWDGDANPILKKPDLLGDYRSIFEPFWNPSVASILSGTISPQDKWAVSGYMANLMASIPTWRRVGIDMYDQMTAARLRVEVDLRKEHGQPIEPELAEGVEMLERGELKVVTEPDYIKALATKNLMNYAWLSYNLDWLIFRNETSQPFITSDNPVAYDHSGVPGSPVWRYLPITPSLCLCIEYDPKKHRIESVPPELLEKGLAVAPKGAVRGTVAEPSDVRLINKLVVQCAEQLVFSSDPFEKLPLLVRKYGKYRMITRHVELRDPRDGGILIGQTLLVRECA
jgi:Protein of unknown function (DUF4238)